MRMVCLLATMRHADQDAYHIVLMYAGLPDR